MSQENVLFRLILDVAMILGWFLNLFILLSTRFPVSYWIVTKFPLGIIFKFGTLFAKNVLKVSDMP